MRAALLLLLATGLAPLRAGGAGPPGLRPPALHAGATSAGADWPTLPEALAAARRTGRPVLVYVHAPTCGPCVQMERTAFRTPGVQRLLARFYVAGLNLDDHESTLVVGGVPDSPFGWARRLGAEATPSFVFLHPDGRPLTRATGRVSTERFERLLAYVATGAHRRVDFEAYVRQTGGR